MTRLRNLNPRGLFQRTQMVSLADSDLIDSAGRIRVSTPVNLFESIFEYGFNSLLWYKKELVNGTVTDDIPNSASKLSVTADIGSRALIQTKKYIRYLPGKSQLNLFAFVMGPTKPGISKFAAQGDDLNAIRLANRSGAVSFEIVSSILGLISVAQADWNIDKMNGGSARENPSKITLDIEIYQVMVIDFTAGVRVGFFVSGKPLYVHLFQTANVVPFPALRTANLPLRFEIINESSAEADVLCAIAAATASEGGFSNTRGIPTTVANLDEVTINRVNQPIFTIRPRKLLNGINNRASIDMTSFSAFARSQNMTFKLIYGGTLKKAGDVPLVDGDWTELTTPKAENIFGFTELVTTITGGIELDSIDVSAGATGNSSEMTAKETILSELPLTWDIDHVGYETITVVCNPIPLSSPSGTVRATLGGKAQF